MQFAKIEELRSLPLLTAMPRSLFSADLLIRDGTLVRAKIKWPIFSLWTWYGGIMFVDGKQYEVLPVRFNENWWHLQPHTPIGYSLLLNKEAIAFAKFGSTSSFLSIEFQGGIYELGAWSYDTDIRRWRKYPVFTVSSGNRTEIGKIEIPYWLQHYTIDLPAELPLILQVFLFFLVMTVDADPRSA